MKIVKAAMGTAVTCEPYSGTFRDAQLAPSVVARMVSKEEPSSWKYQVSRNKGVGSSGRTRTCSPSVNSRLI